MPEESNLPEKPAAENSEKEANVVELDKTSQKPKEITISKVKFFSILFVLLLLMVLEIPLFYSLGDANGKNSNSGTVEKKEVKKDETKDPGVTTVGMNEEVTVNSGITIKLEEAKYDETYEKQKNESKEYYEKNSSQSAYLSSDYFKTSQLNLKIALNNKGKIAGSFSPSRFRLKDSDDVQYVANFDADKQVFGLNPDEKTKITLFYNVPTTEKKFRLIYENAIIEFSLK